MAKYKKISEYTDGPESDPDKPSDPMKEMRTRFEMASSCETTLRQMALDDYRFTFVPGNQWDAWLAKKRGKRPTYEFNTTRQLVKQVTNDQRQNRPQMKFAATNDEGRELNEVMDGMFRNDWNVSSADTAVDTAFRWAVTGGFGVFRCNFRFSEDPDNTPDKLKPSAFYKEIYWEEAQNPFTHYWDPSAKEYTRKDAAYHFEVDAVSRDEFKQRWPKAELVSFEDAGRWGDQTMSGWWGSDEVRIAAYWYKEKEKVTIVMMSDGKVYDADQLTLIMDELAAQGVTEVARREIERDCVYRSLVSGCEVLEGPDKWPGKYIPIIPVWGELSQIDGRNYYTGMVRYLRDAQALKNFHKSVKAELIAKAPKAPFMASPEQIKGFEEMYKNVGETDYSTLMYNQGPNGPPQRSQPPDVSPSLIQAGQEDNEDMKSVAGLYDPSLGAGNGQRSGKAVIAEQRQGNTANFDFIDNLTRSLKFAGEIYADLAPKIYDTTRTRRALGKDGKEQFVQLNQPVMDQQTGQTIYLNDLSQAEFDVDVKVGPSFSSARAEAHELLLNMSQNPQLAPIVADLLAKTTDSTIAEELEKRLRKIGIKAGFIDPDPEEPGEQPQGPSPQEQQMMQAIQQGQQQMQELQQQLQAQEAALAQSKIALAQARDSSAIDAAKVEVDRFNAETNRLKVELDAHEKVMQAQLQALQGQTPPIEHEAPEPVNNDIQALAEMVANSAQAYMAPKKKFGRLDRLGDGSYAMVVEET